MALLCTAGSAGAARAGVWATDPTLGLQGEYSTNPELLIDAGRTQEAHGALLADIPTTYTADTLSFVVQPSFRVANSQGYSSLASDYAHLNAIGSVASERSVLTATLQFDRDSSLYHDYLINGSTGVRRDTSVEDLTAMYQLTERLSASLDGNSSRVLYGQSATFATLVDYRYSTAQPALSWKLNERTSLSLQAAIGLYQSTDGATRSVNDNLQLGFSRQLDELWSLSATAGYSRETNRLDQEVPIFEQIDGVVYETFTNQTYRSSQTGSVFSASVNRQGDRLQLTATASRSLTPSGFALLSTLDSYQAGFHFPDTERWSFDGNVRRVRSVEPQIIGASISQTYLSAGLSTTWAATEKWTVTFGASWVSARFLQPVLVEVNATGATLNMTRHFNTLEWR